MPRKSGTLENMFSDDSAVLENSTANVFDAQNGETPGPRKRVVWTRSNVSHRDSITDLYSVLILGFQRRGGGPRDSSNERRKLPAPLPTEKKKMNKLTGLNCFVWNYVYLSAVSVFSFLFKNTFLISFVCKADESPKERKCDRSQLKVSANRKHQSKQCWANADNRWKL